MPWFILLGFQGFFASISWFLVAMLGLLVFLSLCLRVFSLRFFGDLWGLPERPVPSFL